MKDEVMNYFRKLAGKDVDSQTIADELTAISLEDSDEFMSTFAGDSFHHAGANKTCTYFGDRLIYAMLKSKETAKVALDQFNVKYGAEIVDYNDSLIAEGACIAKVYSIFFADKKYVELQQRIKGEPVAINSLKKVERAVASRVEGLTEEEKIRVMGDEIYRFNHQQQELMKNLPQKAFDDLCKTILLLRDRKTRFYDNHCENILVGKDSFTLIDLNYQKMLTDYKTKTQKPDLYDCIEDFLTPFSLSSMLRKHLTVEQQKALDKNNYQIAKKLVKALQNNNVQINLTDYRINMPFQDMLGENYETYMQQIATELQAEKAPQIKKV